MKKLACAHRVREPNQDYVFVYDRTKANQLSIEGLGDYVIPEGIDNSLAVVLSITGDAAVIDYWTADVEAPLVK